MKIASYQSLFTLLILAVFVVLVFVILLRSTSIISFGVDYSNKTSKASLECMGYVWDLERVSYDGTFLTFSLVNRPTSQDITQVTIVGDEAKSISYDAFYPGRSEEKTIDIKISNNTFYAYVEDCKVTSKTFAVT